MSRVRRLIRGTGTAVITGLVLSACSHTAFDPNAATKVLQSVDVNLDSTGAITDVAGQAVYLDEITGESDSSEESYAVEDVVDDLPVRISTRYETEEGTGTNLDDLEGHTGRVNIEVTVENLTLDSSELTYDVAGESRQTPALVGTPLSVAGSTELEDTRASDIILDAESGTTTNGVVSQTSEGDAVVQWGTVLAPPQSEATTTFQLVADVEDFSTPEIDIAVQAGFHTDMSFEGLLTSTFDTSTDSDYAMQQQAIELVAEVNDVLTRAGTTITDIRTTLDHTTETLGVDAAAQLKQNSDDMVSEMERVGEQMTALESQVDGSMTGAETAMNSQLSQIVASMNSMMGNTDATAPQLMQGQGCAATVEDSEMNGSLYSTFLVLGAQLDGYAEANAECRDEIIAEIANTLGPEVPDAETCDPENGAEDSVTCALLDAQNSVLTSLDDLVQEGEAIVAELEAASVDSVLDTNDEIETHLNSLGTRFDEFYLELDSLLHPEADATDDSNTGDETPSGAIRPDGVLDRLFGNLVRGGHGSSTTPDSEDDDTSDQKNVTWEDLTGSIAELKEEVKGLQNLVNERLQEAIEENRDNAGEGLEEHIETVREDQTRIGNEAAVLSEGHENLAKEICNLEFPDGLTSQEDVEDAYDSFLAEKDRLSIQLVGTACHDREPRPEEIDGPSLNERINELVDPSIETDLNSLAEEQDAHWEKASSALDIEDAESPIGSVYEALTELEGNIGKLENQTKKDEQEKDQEYEDELTERDDKIERYENHLSDLLEGWGQEKDEFGTAEEIAKALGEQDNLDEQLNTIQTQLSADLPEQIRAAFDEVTADTREQLPDDIEDQVRIVTDRVNSAQDSVIESYNSTIAGLATTSDAVINDTADQIDEQQSTLEEQQEATSSALSDSTTAVIEAIHDSTAASTRDLEGASAQLGASLNNVILDLGDPDIQGSGILGSMSASSAMSDTADYQLALASQRASGYANVRSEDIAEIMLRQAQFSASLEAAASLPAFHLDVPSGARSQTIYAFRIGGDGS